MTPRRPPGRDAGTAPDAAPGVLWLAAAGALCGGVGEEVLRFAARLAGRTGTYLNPQGAWLFPLFNLAVVALPALLAWRLGRPQRATARVAFVGASVAALQGLLLVPRVAPWALALLALGVATPVARLAQRYDGRARRLARTTTLLLGAGAAAWGAGWNVARATRAARAMAGRAPARAGAPHVVLVVLDAVRASRMGLYGGRPGTTPFLERLAPSCVRFTRAIAPAPWTLPTHASLFTGRFPRALSVGWTRPLDAREPTLAERFRARGYHTGAAVANYHYTYGEWGLQRGFDTYRDYEVSRTEATLRSTLGFQAVAAWNALRGTYVSPGRKGAGRVLDEAGPILDVARQRPVFLFLNWYDAHDPYAPPPPFDRRFTDGEPPTRAVEAAWSVPSPAAVRGLRDAYDGAIAAEDAALQRLHAELRARGMLERTVLVVTSDHGEEFAEHGSMRHGQTTYLEALWVPLLVCLPDGEGAGTTIDVPVSLRDLPRTLLDVAATGDTLPGYSLRPLWQDGGGAACRSPARSELSVARRDHAAGTEQRHQVTSLVDGALHFFRDDVTGDALYDLRTDPGERTNLARHPAYAATAAALAARLGVAETCAPRRAP